MSYLLERAGETDTIAAMTPTWLVTPLTVEGDTVTYDQLQPVAGLVVEPLVVAVGPTPRTPPSPSSSRRPAASPTDLAATDPEVVALRDRVEVVMDEGLGKRSARVRVRLRDGRDLEASVEHNRGTPANPLSDRDLEVKLLDSAGPLLGAKRAEALLADCWRVEDLEDFGVVARGAAGWP